MFDLENFPTRELARDMMGMISPIYDNSYVGKWIFEVMSVPLSLAQDTINELREQAFPETATWSLPYWEQSYGLPTNEALSIEERRSRVISKRNYRKPMNPARIEMLLKELCGRDQVNMYPSWHQQSIEIQQQFNKSIAELKEGMDQHQKQLEKIEEDIISRERSKLRDRLLQSHRYFTSPEKNPLHAWSEMEADAFWSMFKEYENAKGNGHMHTVVQPEMRALEVIPMHEDAKIAELMGSRK